MKKEIFLKDQIDFTETGRPACELKIKDFWIEKDLQPQQCYNPNHWTINKSKTPPIVFRISCDIVMNDLLNCNIHLGSQTQTICFKTQEWQKVRGKQWISGRLHLIL